MEDTAPLISIEYAVTCWVHHLTDATEALGDLEKITVIETAKLL